MAGYVSLQGSCTLADNLLCFQDNYFFFFLWQRNPTTTCGFVMGKGNWKTGMSGRENTPSTVGLLVLDGNVVWVGQECVQLRTFAPQGWGAVIVLVTGYAYGIGNQQGNPHPSLGDWCCFGASLLLGEWINSFSTFASSGKQITYKALVWTVGFCVERVTNPVSMNRALWTHEGSCTAAGRVCEQRGLTKWLFFVAWRGTLSCGGVLFNVPDGTPLTVVFPWWCLVYLLIFIF